MTDDNTPARADVGPGDKVAGYLLEEQIGQGGMAVVYRAYDERLDRKVALKVLAPSLAADAAFRSRFIRESRAAATVEHPNIIPVYDAGDAGGCLFISMRYVQGGDVRSLAGGDALPPARAWNIINQVASALDAAHTHDLVHRDVKPANMLIDGSVREAGEAANASGPVTEHIYLSDFGISKQTVASNLTTTGQFVGTVDYIAPEQIEGQGIDGRADQYSLACASFELLCGAPPFAGPNIFALINSHLSEQPPSVRERKSGLPPAVDRVIAKAMDKTPGRRYASCAQFAADLGRALGLVAGPVEAGPDPAAETAVPARPYQVTELADPAVAAASDAALAAHDTPPTPGRAVTASPGAVPAGAGAQAMTDQQTMTAGQRGQPMQAPPGTGQQGSTDQQGWTGQQGSTDQQGPGQQWPGQQSQQQAPPGQQWQGGPAPVQQGFYGQQPSPPGQQWQAGPASAQQGFYGQQQAAPFQTYPQPGGPAGTGWPQPPQQPAKRSRGPLIGGLVAVAAVAVAGAVVAVVVLNKPAPNHPRPPHTSSPAANSSPGSPPVATAQSQAQAVNNLLFSSEQSRHTLSTGLINDVGNCGDVQGDVTQIRQVADQRSAEYNQATALQTDLIPDGVTLKSQLMAALKISLRIDNDYLAWARQQANSGCAYGFNSSYYNRATTLDPRATTDKQVFVGTWNPVAQQYGLTQYQASDI